MGLSRIVVDVVGNHGCQREKKAGEQLGKCGQASCTDCMARDYVAALKNAGGNTVEKATITHWPAEKNPPTDDLLAGTRTVGFDRKRAEGAPAETFDFSEALRRLRAGNWTGPRKLARQGWNGKGMYVVRQEGYPDGVPINANTARATGVPEGTVIKFLPYLMMKTADGAFVPWLISQTDALADDWTELE